MVKYDSNYYGDIAIKYHLFLYGTKSERRTNWLKNMAESMPIITEKQDGECMAVYVDDLEVPNVEKGRDRQENYQINVMYELFLMFTILLGVINKAISDFAISSSDEEQQMEKLNRFAKSLDMYNSSGNFTSIGELVAEIENSRNYCKEELRKRAENPNYEINIDGLYFSPTNIDVCMSEFASKVLGSERKMIIILDFPTGNISSRLMSAVNDIILMRTFYWLKVVVEVGQWKNYWGTCGRVIQSTDDYRDVDLDGTYKSSIGKKYVLPY